MQLKVRIQNVKNYVMRQPHQKGFKLSELHFCPTTIVICNAIAALERQYCNQNCNCYQDYILNPWSNPCNTSELFKTKLPGRTNNKIIMHCFNQGFKMRFRSRLRFRSRYGKIALIRQLRSILQISRHEKAVRPTLKPFQCGRFVAIRTHFESMVLIIFGKCRSC